MQFPMRFDPIVLLMAILEGNVPGKYTPKGNYPWAKTPGYFPKVLEWYR
jgi:hypothetical protein